MQHPNRLFRFLIIAVALAAGTPFVVTNAGAQPIHSNLILNGDFEAVTDWTLMDVPGWGQASYENPCNTANPSVCLDTTVTAFASGGGGNASTAWQCVDVESNRAYYMGFEVFVTTDGPFFDSFVALMLADITGGVCPSADQPPPFQGSITSAFQSQPPRGWSAVNDVGIVPPGVTRVAVALHKKNGPSELTGNNFFDNAVFGKHLPNVDVEMAVSDQQLAPLQEFTIEVTYGSRYNGMQPNLRIFHEDRISLVDYDCDGGNVIDASQGSEHYFRWFNIPEDPEPYEQSCTITARAETGFADTFDLHAVADCEDCDADTLPDNNEKTIPMRITVAPDVAATISASEFPEAGDTVEVRLSLDNLGTNSVWISTDVSVVLDLPLHFESAAGTYCFLSETLPGTVEGRVRVYPSAVNECVLTFSIPDDQSQTELGVQLFTLTPGDYRRGNNNDTDATRIVHLLVNRGIDGWDRASGDGICEQTQDSGNCSLRAAVMEANALAAATGRAFTVKVPYSPFSYTLTRTSGDEESLYGSLQINRRMILAGIPDGNGALPLVAASFPAAAADRLIRIGNPAGFVRIENMHLRGQNLVPTDTDGHGTDGGLILHQSGALVLRNVTLADGATDGRGGAIYSASDDTNGDLTLERVSVLSNEANQGGGVAFVPEGFAVLTVAESEIYDNAAGNVGGGLYAAGIGAGALPFVGIERSTIHDNEAIGGGGILFNHVPLATVGNSTVSGNVGLLQGGGIAALQGTALAINNSTIAFNAAWPGNDNEGEGGGIYQATDADVTLYNSVVSSNTGYLTCSQPNPPLPPICFHTAANCYGSLDSAGYNAIATTADSECTFNSEPTDDLLHVQLAPLADNGGFALTHAPASFNTIVDAGDPNCLIRPGGDPLTIDQRGALRPYDGDDDGTVQCDRGAYELSESARVTVAVDDAVLGRVQSSPTGIFCGAGTGNQCSALFAFEAEVALTATVASGSGGEFVGWEGACAGQGNPCTLTASGDSVTTAVFEPTGPVVDALFSDGFESP